MAGKRLKFAVVVAVLLLGGAAAAAAQTGPIVIDTFVECAAAAPDQAANCWQVQVVQAPPGSLPPPDG